MTLGATADASMLGATAFNVGMITDHAFKNTQDQKVAELAGHVEQWLVLDGGPAVVGLNEIAPNIAQKLVARLKRQGLDVEIATHESNSLLWRIP